jgi:hypothetical protein
MLNFLTAHSLAETTPLAAQQVTERLHAQSSHVPSLLLVYFTQAHEAAELRRALKARFPDTAISKRITLDVLPRNFRRRATVKHLELIPDFWAPTVTSGVRIAQTQLLPVSRQHQAAARHQGRRK